MGNKVLLGKRKTGLNDPIVASFLTVGIPIDNITPPQGFSPSVHPGSTSVPLLSAIEQTVPPRHKTILSTWIPKAEREFHCIVESSHSRIRGSCLESTWDVVRDGSRSVAIGFNHSDYPIKLKKGTHLGTVSHFLASSRRPREPLQVPSATNLRNP